MTAGKSTNHGVHDSVVFSSH